MTHNNKTEHLAIACSLKSLRDKAAPARAPPRRHRDSAGHKVLILASIGSGSSQGPRLIWRRPVDPGCHQHSIVPAQPSQAVSCSRFMVRFCRWCGQSDMAQFHTGGESWDQVD